MGAAILGAGWSRRSRALVSGQGSESRVQAKSGKPHGGGAGRWAAGQAACTNEEETMMPDSPEINRGAPVSGTLGILGESGLCRFESTAQHKVGGELFV